MRWLALFAVVLAGAPLAHAGSVGDAIGDVTLAPSGTPYEAAHLDITAASTHEPDAGTLGFSFEVLRSENPSEQSFRRRVVWTFQVEDTAFRIAEAPGVCPEVALLEAAPDGRVRSCLSLEVDAASSPANVTVLVPRSLLAGSAPIGSGSLVHDVRLLLLGYPAYTSSLSQGATEIVYAFDEVTSTALDLRLEAGTRTSGQAAFHATTPTPIRDSNGEEATFVVPIEFVSQRDALVLVEAGQAEQFSVIAPASIQLAKDEPLTIPVAISSQFGHAHGSTMTVPIRFTDATDAGAWVELDVGMHFLDTPQPTGHHPLLWLHSSYGDGFDAAASLARMTEGVGIWMNTLDENPADAASDGPVPGLFAGGDFGTADVRTRHEWTVSLDPGLLSGLQFEENGTVEGEFSISSAQPVLGGVVRGALEYCSFVRPAAECRNNAWQIIAALESSKQDWAAGETRTVSVAGPITGDTFYPDTIGSNLRLTLDLTSIPNAPGAESFTSPMLHVASSYLALPLEEYHEPLDDSFRTVAAVQIDAPRHVDANPGRTVRIPIQIQASHAEVHQITIQAAGTFTEWLHTHRIEQHVQHAGETAFFASIPDDWPVGSTTDFIWIAEDTAEPGIVSVARTTIHVVDPMTQSIPDDQPPASPHKDTPFPFFVPVVLALALGRRGFARRSR